MKSSFIKNLGIAFGLAFLFLFAPKLVSASEGDVDLTNKINTQARCSVFSVFEQDLNYHLLFSCRDITYPGGVEVVNYIMWANPTGGGSPVRLGELQLGKGDFRTQTAFSSLFVSVERDRNARVPSGQIIMEGSVKPRTNLENSPRGTITTTPIGSTEIVQTPSPSPTAKPTNGIARFLTGGIVAFIGLFAVIFILFVITRR